MRKYLNTIFFLSLFSVFHFTSSAFVLLKDTSRQKSCDYKQNFSPNGKISNEGCLKNGKKDGIWKEYDKNGVLHFEWTYADGVKDGPYRSFYENGKVNSIGCNKKNALCDTLKYFDEDGKVYKVEFWVVTGKNQSAKTYEKHFDPKVRPSGTVENIKGKDYIWVDGKRIEMPK